jgi:hypothetical protein
MPPAAAAQATYTKPQSRIIQVIEFLRFRRGLGAHACRSAKFVKIRQPIFRQKFEYGQTALAAEGFVLARINRAAQGSAAVEAVWTRLAQGLAIHVRCDIH